MAGPWRTGSTRPCPTGSAGCRACCRPTPSADTRARASTRPPTTAHTAPGGLAPGEYAVEIQAQAAQEKRVLTQLPGNDATATDRDYEHTYWPGGHGADAALPVTVPSGATVHIGKLRVRKVPYYRVHVRILVAGCEAGEKLHVGESIQNGLGGATMHPLA